MDELREKVGLIIDPLAFSSWVSLRDYCMSCGDDEATATRYADRMHKKSCDQALSKADAAIAAVMEAALPAVWPSERLDDMVRAFDKNIQKHGLRETLMAVVHASLSAFKGTDKGQTP